jgi:hypothetical protein
MEPAGLGFAVFKVDKSRARRASNARRALFLCLNGRAPGWRKTDPTFV